MHELNKNTSSIFQVPQHWQHLSSNRKTLSLIHIRLGYANTNEQWHCKILKTTVLWVSVNYLFTAFLFWLHIKSIRIEWMYRFGSCHSRFSHFCRELVKLCDCWTHGQIPSCSATTFAGRSTLGVVPNFFHFIVIETTMLLETHRSLDNVFYPPIYAST